jgi:hypothetical protein
MGRLLQVHARTLQVKPTTPTKTELRDALESLLKHLGDMPHDWPSRDLYLAYSRANNLLHPDEFTERFMARANANRDTSAERVAGETK